MDAIKRAWHFESSKGFCPIIIAADFDSAVKDARECLGEYADDFFDGILRVSKLGMIAEKYKVS